MKGLRSIPRILKIYRIDGYKVACLFNNGEYRIIDFKDLFTNSFKLKPGQTGFELLEDEKRSLFIGMMIKQSRKEAGLTQEELAQKSRTSKHYISRLENNKSDIELLTLKKIIEAGLNRKLEIQIS